MSSIQNLLSRNKPSTHTKSIPPAIYPAEVIKVEFDTRYVDTAVIITYRLKGETRDYTYVDRYIMNARFKRSRQFYRYLANNGIQNEDDYVGCHEQLDLRWDFSRTGRKELTVYDRVFLGSKEAAGGTEAEKVTNVSSI